MNHHKPLSKRKTVQFMVLLTVLAWATQTLFHQWGFGQEVSSSSAAAAQAPASSDAPAPPMPEQIAAEKFVPSDTGTTVGGTLEMRDETSVLGRKVALKQICRWSQGDQAVFGPLADLTIETIPQAVAFKVITVQDLRSALHDAGVNLAMINFVGASRCTVTRTDANVNGHQAMDQWIDANAASASSTDPASAAAAPTLTPTTRPQASMEIRPPIGDAQPDPASKSLRSLLTEDVCQRFNISPDAIEMSFSPEDEKVLKLSEPYFKFDIKPGRAWNLGAMWWDVTIFTDQGNKKQTINAIARAWQDQVIVARPLEARQVLHETDFTTRRVLSDSLPSIPLLRMDQCVGQAAAMDLKPGTIMTARLVDPVPLVRGGQLVTVILTQGTVEIRSVARAMESGILGQSIKVRNETSRDVFDVTVSGLQETRLGASRP